MSSTIVIKYGGAAMNDAAAAEELIRTVVSIAKHHSVVLVHGGGPEIDKMLKRLNIEPKKVNGIRVTDAATMEVVEMVLAGRVNKGLVSLAQRNGGCAIGISGRDGKIIHAKKKSSAEVDYGFVGSVSRVDTAPLRALFDAKFLPILCSVADNEQGVPLNINADEVAAAVAIALRAHTLALLTDVPGILKNYPDPASRIEKMDVVEAKLLLSSGSIDKGMLPKLAACIETVQAGVKEVKILDGRDPKNLRTALFEGGFGTTITS